MTVQEQKIKLNKKIMLNSLKTFSKILICVIFVFFYIISAMFFLKPNFDAKIFNFFGLKKAEESCYVMQYEKTDAAEDLYNLVLFEHDRADCLKELNYINELMVRDDYKEFCDNLDKSIIAGIDEKAMFYSLTTTNDFLIVSKIRCMNELEMSGIPAFVHSKLSSGDLSETSFVAYVDIIANSNLTDAEKKSKIETLLSVYSVDTKTVGELVDERLTNAMRYVERSTDSVAFRFLVQKAIVETRRANVLVSKMLQKESSEIEAATLLLEGAKQTRNELYAQILI
ncbi:MAG: hypothetical protein IKB06_00420 [Clostridia bacterium]|nr:hypothetical protein [Clostridia bacterium]